MRVHAEGKEGDCIEPPHACVVAAQALLSSALSFLAIVCGVAVLLPRLKSLRIDEPTSAAHPLQGSTVMQLLGGLPLWALMGHASICCGGHASMCVSVWVC